MLFECHRETCGDRTGSNLWFTLIDRLALASSMNAGWETGRYTALRLKRQKAMCSFRSMSSKPRR
jgi:hypothetical protein